MRIVSSAVRKVSDSNIKTKPMLRAHDDTKLNSKDKQIEMAWILLAIEINISSGDYSADKDYILGIL